MHGIIHYNVIVKRFSDIALRIVEDRQELASNESVLRILAKKPGAFSGESSNFIKRTINWGKRIFTPRSIIHRTCQNKGSV